MSYRASASKGTKPKGQSASAKHAYHQRTGGYAVGLEGAREDLVASGAGNLPAWADGPASFWLATDSYERANGTLFRDLQLNLPAELNLNQQQAVVEAYAERMFDAERLPFSWAIHKADKENPNPHAHLMVSESKTDSISRTAEMHFRRFNPKNPEKGGVQKTRTLKPKSWLMEARAAWAEEVNRGLVAAGHKPRFDHRSKEVQLAEALRLGDLRRAARLDTPTQAHEGPRIAGMRRRVEAGKVALDELPDYAQAVIKNNDHARELARAWLAQVELMTDAELAEHFAEDLNHGGHVEAWRLHQEQLHQQQAHAEALAEAQRRDAADELAALIEQEQSNHLGDLQAIEIEQAHAEALAEDAERDALHDRLRHQLRHALAEGAIDRAGGQSVLDRLVGAGAGGIRSAVAELAELRAELAELVASEARQQAVELAELAAVQAAHIEALDEDAERTRLHDRLRHQLRHALAEGAIDRAGGQSVLDRLVGAGAGGIRSAVAELAELRAELVASESDQQTVELGQLAAVQADDLVDQYNQRLARLGLHQLPDLDLGDPATLIHHDDEPQWLVVENRDGEVIGHWSDDPDAQWRYDHDSGDWVEHDHRPSSGPRMG